MGVEAHAGADADASLSTTSHGRSSSDTAALSSARFRISYICRSRQRRAFISCLAFFACMRFHTHFDTPPGYVRGPPPMRIMVLARAGGLGRK